MDTSTYTPGAAAHVTGGTDPSGPVGWVSLQPQGQRVLVTAQIRGLPDNEAGFFALHIHEGRDCSGEGFPMTGSHYDPTDAPHPATRATCRLCCPAGARLICRYSPTASPFPKSLAAP